MRLASEDIATVLSAIDADWRTLRRARLLITGATGFFGCWMLETALAANRQYGLQMQIFAQSRDPRRFFARVPHLSDGVEWVESAPLALDVGRFGSSGLDAIVHLVTEASAEATRARPDVARATILGSTEHALALAVATGARRFLFASSGSVYRRTGGVHPYAEGDPLWENTDDPTSVYAFAGAAKREAEEACARAVTEHGLVATIARGFTFVGPHLPLDGKFAIGNFLRDALAGRDVVLTGDGASVRSYLYAADMAAWLWAVMLRGQPGGVYNVGSSHAVSLRELAEVVVREVAPRSSVRVLGAPTGGLDVYVPDTRRAERELGVRETVALDEAVRRTANWCRMHLRG